MLFIMVINYYLLEVIEYVVEKVFFFFFNFDVIEGKEDLVVS